MFSQRVDVSRDSLIVSESQKECARRKKKCHLCKGRQCEWGENGLGKTITIIIFMKIKNKNKKEV